ncbi:unnamed protein product [Cunninghamella echinulata]
MKLPTIIWLIGKYAMELSNIFMLTFRPFHKFVISNPRNITSTKKVYSKKLQTFTLFVTRNH